MLLNGFSIGAKADYNYYIIGGYKDYEMGSRYNDLLALYVTSHFNDENFLSADEFHSIRKELCPNTFGMIKAGYEKDIALIDNVEEVRIYGDFLFGVWR